MVLVLGLLPHMPKVPAILFICLSGVLVSATLTILLCVIAGLRVPKLSSHFTQSVLLYLMTMPGVLLLLWALLRTGPIPEGNYVAPLLLLGLSGVTLVGNAIGLGIVGIWSEARSNTALQPTFDSPHEPALRAEPHVESNAAELKR